MRLHAYHGMRGRTWSRVAQRYLALAERSLQRRRATRTPTAAPPFAVVGTDGTALQPASALPVAGEASLSTGPQASSSGSSGSSGRESASPQASLTGRLQPKLQPRAAFLSSQNGERGLRFDDTPSFAVVENGVVAVEASRPVRHWTEFRTGLHFRRGGLGRSDYFLLGGAFSFASLYICT